MGAVELAVEGPSGAFVLPERGRRIVSCATAWTCIEQVLGPGALGDGRRVILRLPDIDHEADGPIERVPLPSYQVGGDPKDENTALRVALERDPIAEALATERREGGRPPFERRFELAVAAGPCGGAAPFGWRPVERFPADRSVLFSPGDAACASLRPAEPPDGPVVAQRTIDAAAVVRGFRYLFAPPERAAPLVFLTLFDFEVPNPSRCEEVQTSMQATLLGIAERIAEGDGRGAPTLALPPVMVAEEAGVRCRQANLRSFDAENVAEQAAVALEARFPGTPVRLLIVYAANLPLPLPMAVRVSVFQLIDALGRRRIPSLLVALGPDPAVAGLDPAVVSPWLSPLEPAFESALFGVLGPIWPFVTVAIDPGTPIPLADAATREGLVAYRLCDATGQAFPAGAPIGQGNARREGPEGPGFFLGLAPVVLAPSGIDRPAAFEVPWEGCYGLCDRAPPGGGPSWLNRSSCGP